MAAARYTELTGIDWVRTVYSCQQPEACFPSHLYPALRKILLRLNRASNVQLQLSLLIPLQGLRKLHLKYNKSDKLHGFSRERML